MSIPDPILRFRSSDGKTVDILDDWDIADPYWRPQIAQYKGGGTFINSGVAEGKRLVSKEYDNVVETIPLTARGTDQDKCIQTIRELLQLGRQAADYWTEIYEFDDVWLECKPACNDCLTGYVRIIKMSIPELSYPFGQPFFTGFSQSMMDDLTLTIERDPLWRGVAPGELVGPLYNLLRNPDFELWNFGTGDSQPDNWTDLETIQITGQNNRDDSAPHSGNFALKVRVSGSTLTGRIKGVTQLVTGTRSNQEYTVVAWVRNEGVSNGVGRILVTYSSQLEVYRSGTAHGWTLYTGKFTTGNNDTVSINCEILTTAANTDGTVYFDSLMVLEGDFEQEAIDGVLPYLSSSHLVNHQDTEAGDINYLDVWNVPGDEDALVRLEVQNNTAPADTANPIEVISHARIGMRRTGDIFNFDNYFDPAGLADATASNDDRLESLALNASWVNVATKLIEQDTTDNQGRFRLLARVYDPATSGDPTLALRLRYFAGAMGIGLKTLNPATALVTEQWHILSLATNAAVNWDTKFSPNPPAQLGYSLQMSRPSGSDKGYLDYAMLLPTDGGFLDAEVNPPVTYGNALIADNTNSQAVGATQLRSGWRQIFGTTTGITAIIGFNNGIFVASSSSPIIYRYQGGEWATVYSAAGNNTFRDFEVFNGAIYASYQQSPTASPVSVFVSTDGGNTWGLAFTIAQPEISKMRAFDGKLFIIAGTNTHDQVYYYDGTNVVASYAPVGAVSATLADFEVYGGKLYAVGARNDGGPLSGGYVYQYDPTSENWTIAFNDAPSSSTVTQAKEFKGQLITTFVNPGVDVRVYRFDGGTWQYSTFPILAANIGVLESYNDKLYAGSDVTANPMMTSEDAITWTATYEILVTTGASISITASAIIGSTLYIGLSMVGGRLYTLAEEDVIYNVSDWQGILFQSPPLKRHRFFVNVDRQNFINVTTDQILMGVGFVPRYLALRGHG